MVSVSKDNNGFYSIILKPNSSLIGSARVIFIFSISFICIFIATIFYILGATLILPFAGLEVCILLIAFYLNFKWSSKIEKINISQDLVIIEKGIKKVEYKWEEFRTFTSFQVSKDVNEILQLSFKSKGKNVEVGAFLNEEDKCFLKDEISQIIDELNAETFSSP